MRIEKDKTLILNKIKSHYKFKSDAEFARFLEIKPNSLANWYSRNTLDYEKIFSKCEHINANWLFSGEGEMFCDHQLIDYSEKKETQYLTVQEENVDYNESYWRGRYDQLKEDYDRLIQELQHIKSASAS